MSDLIVDRCPVCRARLGGNEDATDPCRRCGIDLTWVRRATDQARVARGVARRHLADGRPRGALQAARRAVSLVDCSETRTTLCAALAACGHFGEATHVLGQLNPPRRRGT